MGYACCTVDEPGRRMSHGQGWIYAQEWMQPVTDRAYAGTWRQTLLFAQGRPGLEYAKSSERFNAEPTLDNA